MPTITQAVLDRLFSLARNNDGQAGALQQQAVEAVEDTGAEEPPSATAPRRRRAGKEPQRVLLESLAAKTLHAWMQNRHQTLFPLTLNFRVLDPAGRALLVRMAALAAWAEGGEPEAAAQERIQQAIAAAGAGAEERRLLEEALAEPGPLPSLLRQVQAANLGPHAYAASLLALDRGGRAGRAWLGYLAARFALPPEVIHGLDRRRR